MTGATRPNQPAESFSYDKVGNILTSVDASNWTYNQNNALIGYDGVNYMYDQNGNTTSKNESGQITSYLYTANDRLAQVNLPNGHIATYLYDPFGRRISKTVDGKTTYFMYADEGLIAEMDSSGNVQKTYGWKPSGTWGTNPVLMTQGGSVYFYHNDHLGTPQKMTDATGNIVWSAVYTSFGEATVDGTSTITNNLKFPGQYYDAETGLNYNWNRYYDSKAGRYISEDPIGFWGGINLYCYVRNNSLNHIDVYGLIGYGPINMWTDKDVENWEPPSPTNMCELGCYLSFHYNAYEASVVYDFEIKQIDDNRLLPYDPGDVEGADAAKERVYQDYINTLKDLISQCQSCYDACKKQKECNDNKPPAPPIFPNYQN